MKTSLPLLWITLLTSGVFAAEKPILATPDRFALDDSPLAIRQAAQPGHPFTVAGEGGAILGWQDGRFELWDFPVKLLGNFHITAELANYPVAIDVNRQATSIEVHPDHTTIVYSHAAFTVRQHMFAPRGDAAKQAGAVVLFEIDSSLPGIFRFQFDPLLAPLWPASQYGRPDASALEIGGGGAYLLETPDPRFYGVLAMPQARKIVDSPYDEWTPTGPLEFTLDFDPKRDRDKVFPLIATAVFRGEDLSPKIKQALAVRVAEIDGQIPGLYSATRDYYRRFFDDKVTVKSPAREFDRALAWAEIAIDQCQVRHGEETGIVAGWHSSGNSARPGFGWFFGRDTLWSLYGIDSYGGFALARRGLDFLMARQRADGKMMHEFSQTSDMVDYWARLPFAYAAADATPLFIMAMEDYVRSSGDRNYLREHWDNIQRAYSFLRQHDSDGDGIYDNSEGTGWVETWKPKLPHQELYLAALDQQSAESFSRLAAIAGNQAAADSAAGVARAIREKLTLYRRRDGFYAFSRNADGTYDYSRTIFPSVAWWTGRLALSGAEPMLDAWASHEFATDWGVRSLSPADSFYDPLLYHQGTVWPLFTGWTAMAEYRAGRPLAGYSQLISSLDQTYTYDPGAIVELLSGRFFAAMPRGSSHQLWSSAMTLNVAVRGLLGIEVDALHGRLYLAPHLPASWNEVEIANVPFGDRRVRIAMQRRKRNLEIDVRLDRPESLCIDTATVLDTPCSEPAASEYHSRIPLPAVEVGILPVRPAPGAETIGMKVLEEHYSANKVSLKLEAPAGTTQRLQLRINDVKASRLKVSGGTIEADNIAVRFPAGEGYQTQAVEIGW